MDNDKTSKPKHTKRNWSLLEDTLLQKYPSFKEVSLAAENKEKELAGLFHEFHKIGMSEKDIDKAAKREIGQKNYKLLEGEEGARQNSIPNQIGNTRI